MSGRGDGGLDGRTLPKALRVTWLLLLWLGLELAMGAYAYQTRPNRYLEMYETSVAPTRTAIARIHATRTANAPGHATATAEAAP
jgi:hypothetical protein